MEPNAEATLRPDWIYDIRTRCQEFHNRTFATDRSGFEAAVRWLRCTTPASQTIQEADWLKTLLKDSAVSSAIAFHRRYHRRKPAARCAQSPVEASYHVWSQHDDDPRVMLERWLTEFLEAFDAEHPTSLAERAATVLRSQFLNPPRLDELARALGTSRSVLTVAFKQEFSLTCGEYVECVRVQHFISEARTSADALTTIAEQSGYRSYKNLVAALRRQTGLLPRSVRTLASAECERLHARSGSA